MKDVVIVRQSVSQKRYVATATDTYHGTVAGAAEYLAARGIDERLADTYLLGYVAEPLVGDEEYAGRLAIPYLTSAGPIDIRFRSLGGEQPKYLSRAGAKTHMFNVRALYKPSPWIAVCEGEFDTIIMDGAVGVPAVGVPGANNWRDHFRLLLEDYELIFVLCDGDQAGRDFGKKVASEVDGATVVHLPDGTDVNDLYLAEGKEGLLKRLGL